MLSKNEKILKRALEMAVKEFAESSSCPCDNHAYCHQFPFCGHTDCVAHSVALFIRKAKARAYLEALPDKESK